MVTEERCALVTTVLLVVLSYTAHAQQGATPTGQGQPRRAAPAAEGPSVLRDLEYARAGEKVLQLDLYLPERSEAPVPLVVWVHGGAWMAGNRSRCPAARMVPKGYAAASISYRLSQEAIFPAQIEDCKAAIRWLRANATKYRIDPNRIGVWGSSAGGHLVALLGTAGDVKDWDRQGGNLEYSSRVQAVCDFFGPTDFCQMTAGGSAMDHDASDSPESQLIGGPIQQNKDKVARANPITYVSKDDPPFLILHGDRDRTVPMNQSELLHAALKQAGVDVKLHIVKGAGHGFRGPEIDAMVDAFFNQHLKQSPSAGAK